MLNPFYVLHLEKLMDNGAEENIVPQLYEWLAYRTANPGHQQMSLEDFAACIELMLSRVEEAAMQEQAYDDEYSSGLR